MITSLVIVSSLLIGQTSPKKAETPKSGIVVSVQSLKWIVQELYPLEKIEVICPPGTSPHSFELRPESVKIANNARFALSISPEYDAWFDQLKLDRQVSVLNLIPKEFQVQPIFEAAHAHEGHDHSAHNHAHDHGSVDPHFWMDPLAVRGLLDPLTKKICEWEPKDCESVKNRAATFAASLQILNDEVKKIMDPVANKPFLSSHDGFGYFVKRYKLDYLEPIEPLPGKEPSPKDIKRLIDLSRSKGVLTIFGELQLPLAPVQALAEATRTRLQVLDQYGATDRIQNYSDLILENAQKIKSGLAPESPGLAP